MRIYQRIYDLLRQRAVESRVRFLSVGLGYTAVVLEDESIGIAYTWIENKTSCSLFEDPNDYEGTAAAPLLEKLFAEDLLSRSVALAAVNALNYPRSSALPTDSGTLLEDLGVGEGSRVAMVGYFAPIAERLRAVGATLNVYDLGKGIGGPEEFAANLSRGVEACILSSTTIINGTIEALLSCVGENVACALLGPSTPMLPEAFEGLPVTILAGTCPVDTGEVLKAIRHARGTRSIHRSSRKVYWRRATQNILSRAVPSHPAAL